MARIFISHSSVNNAEAVALRDWLIREGWNDLFLDLDPTQGISAGERWERALYQAANRCEAVLFLFSDAWCKSPWCLREFHLSAKLNKQLFGLFIEEVDLTPGLAGAERDWQAVDLAGGTDHEVFRSVLPDGSERHVTFSTSALSKLKAGLTKAGLDSRFFAWPPADEPDRPPYRGLRALEAEDAGIFFGREASIIEAIDRLRGLREASSPGLFVILGASGAGKSSFLRAGILPRLSRDDRHFVTMPVIRPERAAITGETGFLQSLETASKKSGLRCTRAEIRTTIGSGISAVQDALRRLAERARPPALDPSDEPPTPTLVLPIDQGDELFLAEGEREARAFLGLVSSLISSPASNLLAVVTMRSDSYENLQTAPELEGVEVQVFNLPPLPRSAYHMVIEGPARHLQNTPRALQIDPALAAKLLADLDAGEGKDALPLLAFTLERLYVEHGGGGTLTLAQYGDLGGIRGSIEAAVERALKAADEDSAVTPSRSERLALLRHGIIPWLAGVDPETGAPRRRVARFSEIPADARPLLKHLVTQRLLSVDIAPDTGEGTIEPAHEALLRQWSLLQAWLEEDLAALASLEGVRRASRDWIGNGEDVGWLVHTGGRLEDAEAIAARGDLAGMLSSADRGYLVTCRWADDARRNRALREANTLAEAQAEAAKQQRRAAKQQRRIARQQTQIARRTRLGLVAASVLAAFAVGTAVFSFDREREANKQRAIAEQQTEIAKQQAGEARRERERADDLRSEAEIDSARYAAAIAAGRFERADFVHALLIAREALPSQYERRFARERTGALSELSKALAPLEGDSGYLRGHEDEVKTAAFSPDGTRVATASSDHTARIWDANECALITVLQGHTDKVTLAAFSPNGARVVTGSADRTARIWNARTGALLHILRGHEGTITSTSFAPDGRFLVTASTDGTARIWDTNTGRTLHVLGGYPHSVNTVTYSPDGALVATGSADGITRIWDAETGASLHVLGGLTPVTSVAFSPNGTQLIATSDRNPRIWDSRTGELLRRLAGHTGWVNSAAFSPDGQRIVTASVDGTSRIWDAAKGTTVHVLTGGDTAAFSLDGDSVLTVGGDARLWDVRTGLILRRFERAAVSAALSPDDRLMVTVAHRGEVRIWNVDTGAARNTFGQAGRSVLPSPDGKRIVTVSGAQVDVWNTETGANVSTIRGHDVDAITFSPNGKLVATASSDGTTRILDVESGVALHTFDLDLGHFENAVGFSFSGKRLVTASSEGTVRIWNTETGLQLRVLQASSSSVAFAAFSPDGEHVVTSSWDGAVRIWDADTGALAKTLEGKRGDASWIVFSPAGKRLATTPGDGTARIWDAKTGILLTTLRGHTARRVTSGAFSPDGNLVATGSADGTARLWDADTGAVLNVLVVDRDEDDPKEVHSVEFSPDGRRLLTISSGLRTCVWDIETGALLQVLWDNDMYRLETLLGQTHAALPVYDGAFLPDGRHIVTAGPDTAHLWRVVPQMVEVNKGSLVWTLHPPFSQALLDRARQVLPRELTERERGAILKER